MKFTENLTLTLLLAFTSSLLLKTSSTPIPAAPLEPSPTDLQDLALVNQKSYQISLPVYRVSEDGLAAEPLNQTTVTGSVYCQTTSGSPYVWDIYRAAYPLGNKGGWCRQLNPGGSECTSHAHCGTAALSLCGTWMHAVRCHELAWVGRSIAENCKWKNRAGGEFYFRQDTGWLHGVVHWNI